MQSWHLHVAVWKNVEWILSCRYCDIQILIRNFKYATSKLNKSDFGIAPPTRGNFRVNGGDQVIRIQSPTSEQSYLSHFFNLLMASILCICSANGVCQLCRSTCHSRIWRRGSNGNFVYRSSPHISCSCPICSSLF